MKLFFVFAAISTLTLISAKGAEWLMLGDYAEAESMLSKSLNITETEFGFESPESIQILNNLATLYRETCDYEDAERCFNIAIKIHESKLGGEDTGLATLYNNLADVYVKTGNYTKAENLFLNAI
jgi:tetratricopeptide (TPR) repeat protein